MNSNHSLAPIRGRDTAERRLRDALMYVTDDMPQLTQRARDLRRNDSASRVRYLNPLVELHFGAIFAGADLARSLAFCRELESMIRAQYLAPNLCLVDANINETIAQCVLDPIQTKMIRNPEDKRLLAEAEGPVYQHIDALHTVRDALNKQLRGSLSPNITVVK